MVFLHHQEKILARRGYENAAGSTGEYVQHVFTPTPQDKGVIAFRKWLQYSAGGGVPWAQGRDVGERSLGDRGGAGRRLAELGCW